MRNTDIINIKRLCDMFKDVGCEIDIGHLRGDIDFYNKDGEIVYGMTFHMDTFKDDVAKCLSQVEADLAVLEVVKKKLIILGLLEATTEKTDR
jgi:hypothetical protein